MGNIFLNSENSRTSDAHRLFPNLPDRMNSKNSDKYVALSNLNIHDTWKNIKT